VRCIVIGSEGNLGAPLVIRLRADGHEVLRVDHLPGSAPDYVQCDLLALGDLWPRALALRPDVIYHLAAMVSRVTCEASPHLAIDTNLGGLNNVIQLAKALPARLVFFSTSEVYGNQSGLLSEATTTPRPNNRYGLSKYLGEQLVNYEVEHGGLDAVVVRPFMIYGEDETRGDHRSAMIRFVDGLVAGQPITVHEHSARSWLHISDATEMFSRLGRGLAPVTLNIGHPECLPTETLARYLCAELGRPAEQFLRLAPLPPRMTLVKQPDLRRQRELLGYAPRVSVWDGARLVIERVRAS
jgi:nucleoside-diphosphate-sugar epimerase